MKKKKIAMVTGARSEYGILKPLLRAIRSSKLLELEVFVAGMHLLKSRGFTAKEIEKDGFSIKNKVPMYIDYADKKDDYSLALATGIKNFSGAFLKDKPDIVVVLGDRLEALSGAIAAWLTGFPLAHIHGGDKTDSGHIDEITRNVITRLSNLHFAPTKKCKERLLKWGEEPKRVFLTGTLGVDAIMQMAKTKKEDVFKDLRFDPAKELAIFLFNPVSVEANKSGKQAGEILSALKGMALQTVVIYPNNDEGSEDIISKFDKFRKVEYFRFFPSMSSERYAAVLKNCNFIIGNSSSGIIEAPVFKIAAINVGSRNKGREHAGNVLYVEPEETIIKAAIKKILHDKNLINKIKNSKSPWGQGGAAGKIVKILESVKIEEQLLRKKVTY